MNTTTLLVDDNSLIYRESELTDKETSILKDRGYLSEQDDDEVILYHPDHWSFISPDCSDSYDYMFDNLAFHAKSVDAKALATSEGF